MNAAEQRLFLIRRSAQGSKPPANHSTNGRGPDFGLIPVGPATEAGRQQLDVTFPVHVRVIPLVLSHWTAFRPSFPCCASNADNRFPAVESRSKSAFTAANIPSLLPGFMRSVR